MATSRRKATLPAAKEPEYKNEICDNCRLSKWATDLHDHTDHNGKPILLSCPKERYYIVRGRKACQHFERKG